MAEEIFYNGEYLRNFADSLVVRGHGKRRKDRKNASDIYRFSHRNLNNLVITVSQNLIGFGDIMTYDVKLSGSREQIREFIRAASREVDREIGSKESVARQMKEIKKYEAVLKEIGFDKIDNFLGQPVFMSQLPCNSEIPTWASIGHIVERNFHERSFWIEKGFNLKRHEGEDIIFHQIDGAKYVGGGYYPSNSTIICDNRERRNKLFLVEAKYFSDIMDRIQDERPVFLS